MAKRAFETEIPIVIKASAPYEAPSLNGYTIAYFNALELIKQDIMEAIHHFHQTGQLVKSCNASFIALIPKKKGIVELKDYRLISLIGSFYKVVQSLN